MKKFVVMKKIVITWLVVLLLLGGALFSGSGAEAAEDSVGSVQNIFIDTLYGMGTGLLLATAITAARGEADSSDWGENLGAGAAVGGVLGAGYGVFFEYNRGLTELTNNGICFHVPTITPLSGSNSGDIILHADLLRIHF
jgi:hypothetical protein